MTRIEQIERKRLYSKLQDELSNIVNAALEFRQSAEEEELDNLVCLGENINNTVERYKLASEMTPTIDDNDSAIRLTQRVVASLGLSRRLEGRKLDYEQSCQIILSIVTSLRDQQAQLRETLKQVTKEYNIQSDWYIDNKLRKRPYIRPLTESTEK